MKSLYSEHDVLEQSRYNLSIMFLHCAPLDNAFVLSEHSEFFIPVIPSCLLWNSILLPFEPL